MKRIDVMTLYQADDGSLLLEVDGSIHNVSRIYVQNNSAACSVVFEVQSGENFQMNYIPASEN